MGLVTIPLKKKVTVLQAENQNILEKKAKLATEFKRVQETFQTLTNENKKADRFIPTGYDQETFLADIEAITKKNGFSVESLAFSLGHNDQVKAEQINASFSLEGARTNIYNFLVDVENNPNFMGLSSFGIQSGSSDDQSVLGVSLYSFFQEK